MATHQCGSFALPACCLSSLNFKSIFTEVVGGFISVQIGFFS